MRRPTSGEVCEWDDTMVTRWKVDMVLSGVSNPVKLPMRFDVLLRFWCRSSVHYKRLFDAAELSTGSVGHELELVEFQAI